MELINHDPLVTSMSEVLDRLPPLSPSCCIYRVPKRLRRVSEQAYTPQVVSIGPLHHGKEALKAMEELKNRYLQDFLHRTNVSLEYFIRKIRAQEAKLRSCYAETIGFSRDEFVRIILVDAAFIIEVLLRFCYKHLRVENDRIFNKPRMLEDVWPDMRMLENQLPFFILEDLFDHERNIVGIQTTIIDLSYHFFKTLMHMKDMEDIEDTLTRIRPPHQVEHFVDFVRKLYPLPPQLKSKLPQGQGPFQTLTTGMISSCVMDIPQARGQLESRTIPSMTQLYRAGVKFKKGSSTNIFDIRFNIDDGILEIPKITISDQSEVTLTNLLVFEQTLCKKVENYINDYVVILNILVNTPEDVALLVKNGIVENKLGDSTKACTMIKNLADGVIMADEFYFTTLCENLNKYYRMFRHRWKEYLIKHFFNSPWTTKEIVAAAIFLMLTFIQTVCSIISAAQQ